MIDLGGVAVIPVADRRGWTLNMILVRLPSGGLLVHSPTFGGDQVYAEVEAYGRPEVLLAPNHYHHLSLQRYRERYPDARAVCSDGARPRLEKKGHAGLGRLDQIALFPGAHFLELPHVKNGEVWISLPGEGGPTFIVCDGLFHLPKAPPGAIGLILRALGVAPGLKLSRTFRWLIRDRRAYRAWLLETLQSERPRRVLFSHGDPLVDDVTTRLIALVEASLPE